jgi:hypothetical protein
MTKTVHIIADDKGNIKGAYSSRKAALTNLDEHSVYHFRRVDKKVYSYLLSPNFKPLTKRN